MASSQPRVHLSGAATEAPPATFTFDDDLGKLFVPEHTIVIQRCNFTGDQRAYRVLSSLQKMIQPIDGDSPKSAYYALFVEYLDLIPLERALPISDSYDHPAAGYRIGKARTRLQFQVDIFNGVRDINTLPVYPIQYHPTASTLEDELDARGRYWASLCQRNTQCFKFTGKEVRLTFNYYPLPTEITRESSQVAQFVFVLDHEGYFTMTPQAKVPLGEHIKAKEHIYAPEQVCKDDWRLAPAVVYGYSISKRRWMAYEINGIFEEYPVSSKNGPAVELVDTTLRDIVRTHTRINAISKSVIGEDSQGLLLMLHGSTAWAKARAIAQAYQSLGRPRHTFFVSEVVESSELDSFRKAISSNAVLVVQMPFG
ncbi:hypothetical protein C8T65DRAFT_834357 [Cerioporus squamosus]|nr:hypothetical protein C8T65DRAFT_834357 [Cerioporus squamosus]